MDKNPKKVPKHKKEAEKVNRNLHSMAGETETNLKHKKVYE